MENESIQQELVNLYRDFALLRNRVLEEGNQLYASWEPETIRHSFRKSALNFAYYVALRRRDVRELQIRLSQFGLSSLGRLEGQVMSSLDTVLANLSRITKIDDQEIDFPETVQRDRGQEKLAEATETFFGPIPSERYTRIMVTMPPEASEDYELVSDLVVQGMNVARINCAHDNAEEWQKMITNIRKAAAEHEQVVKIYFDIAGPKVRIDAIYTNLQNPKLLENDTFFLTFHTALEAFYGQEIVLSCEVPEVISDLKVGESVRLDDGKIIGVVESMHPEGAIVRITQLQKPSGVKVKATKGINFPDRVINLPVLTDKDLEDLQFAKDHADVIGFSFITHLEDIPFIQEHMTNEFGDKAGDVPIVIKAETVGGFNNLVDIIVEANRKNPTGVMIARGDLAVEAGYLRLSVMQEEILWLCEAARVPVIWATQVLETMVKTGVPTRAEITDASMGSRAECIMLNKGAYIRDGVIMLRDVLENIDEHQFKKTPLLKALNVARQAFAD